MNKNIKIILAVLLVVIGIVTSFAIGAKVLNLNHMGTDFGCDYNDNSNGLNNDNKNLYHDKMEAIIERGTYNDLVNLRKETSVDFANFVKNENDFNLLKQRHEEMDNLMGGMMR